MPRTSSVRSVPRQIQAHPGLQRFEHRALAALLRADAADLIVQLGDPVGKGQRIVYAVVLKEGLRLKLGLCREELALDRRILREQLQGMVKGRLPAARGHDAAAFRSEAFGLKQLLPRLGDLHAAKSGQLAQQLLLAGTNGDQP